MAIYNLIRYIVVGIKRLLGQVILHIKKAFYSSNIFQ